MTENKETLEEIIKTIQEELKEISKKTGIKTKDLLPIMANRELVIMNTQLRAIHEHIDTIEKSLTNKAKTKCKKEVT